MVPRNHILSAIVITIFIGISPNWAWIAKDQRYDGYNLEKGPVFYEAYYPESNENPPAAYQEKRYFDRDAILERTFQIPADRREYTENPSKNEYPDRLEPIRYNRRYGTDPKLIVEQSYAKVEGSRPYETRYRPYGIDRYPATTYSEQRRSTPGDPPISRDFENWNTLENYNYLQFDPKLAARRRLNIVDEGNIDRSYFQAIPERDLLRAEIFERTRSDEGDETESLREIRKNLSVASPKAIQPLELSKDLESMKRLSQRDVRNRNQFGSFDPIDYPEYPHQQYRYSDDPYNRDSPRWISDVNSLPNQRMESVSRSIEALPSENIFAPRPQVINYVFSKSSSVDPTEKPATTTTTIAEVAQEEPRKYGDNLLQEELKKIEGEKDKSAKVTSIEISEVPRHKIRHHHGEWLRDFAREPK